MTKTTFNNGPLANVDLETKALADGGLVQIVAEQFDPVNPGLVGDLTQTITGTAAAITNLPATAVSVLISFEGGPLRWLDNNQTPTASVGHLMVAPASDSIFLMVNGRTRLTNFKMILTTATTASARYTFYL